jgi:hypothetical protein
MNKSLAIVLLFCFLQLLQISCALSPLDATNIDKPPTPATQSILPLGMDNRWIFWYTSYDSSGNMLPLVNRVLQKEVAGVYGLTSDNRLISFDSLWYEKNIELYIYKYEWGHLDSGYLVFHNGKGELYQRGLYITGTYKKENLIRFDSAILWFPYPAVSGTKWSVLLPGSDSSSVCQMELVSTTSTFLIPVNNGAVPALKKDSCYLYKEINEKTVSYYYFHPEIGCLGYLRYENGILAATYNLNSYKVTN